MKAFYCIIFWGICSFSYAQEQDSVWADYYTISIDSHISIRTGYHVAKYNFAELGIAWDQIGAVGFHPYSQAVFLSGELMIGKDMIIGTKFGGYFGGGVGGTFLGFNLINYTDFEENTLRLRPEFGGGTGWLNIVYGYNFPLTNADFQRINRHVFSMNILIPAITLKKIRKNFPE